MCYLHSCTAGDTVYLKSACHIFTLFTLDFVSVSLPSSYWQRANENPEESYLHPQRLPAACQVCVISVNCLVFLVHWKSELSYFQWNYKVSLRLWVVHTLVCHCVQASILDPVLLFSCLHLLKTEVTWIGGWALGVVQHAHCNSYSYFLRCVEIKFMKNFHRPNK